MQGLGDLYGPGIGGLRGFLARWRFLLAGKALLFVGWGPGVGGAVISWRLGAIFSRLLALIFAGKDLGPLGSGARGFMGHFFFFQSRLVGLLYLVGFS